MHLSQDLLKKELFFYTKVVLLRCPLVTERMHGEAGTWGLPLPVKAGKLNIMTFTVLLWLKNLRTQNKKNK